MGKREKKVPKNNRGNPEKGKKAKGHKKAISIENKLFSLHLGYLDFDGPFGWKDISIEKLKGIIGTIKHFESMTWSEIKSATHGVRGRSNNHFVPVCECSKEAQKRYWECFKYEGEDEVFSLRLSGKERVFRVVSEGIFKVLWWDPDHKVYEPRDR